MKRQAHYQWRLREVMATRGLFNTTDLAPLLAEHGVELSAVQIWRLVAGTPERLSLPVLAALCDILEVTPSDLITTSAENVALRKAVGAVSDRVPSDPSAIRPKRARIRPEP